MCLIIIVKMRRERRAKFVTQTYDDLIQMLIMAVPNKADMYEQKGLC